MLLSYTTKDAMVTFSDQCMPKLCKSSLVLQQRTDMKSKPVRPLEELPVNQWRMTWVTHPKHRDDTRKKYIDRKREELLKKDKKEEKDRAKALKEHGKILDPKPSATDGTYTCCMTALHDHDVKTSNEDRGWLCSKCFRWMCSQCAGDFQVRHEASHPVTSVHSLINVRLRLLRLRVKLQSEQRKLLRPKNLLP